MVKVVKQWQTVAGVHVFETDANVRFTVYRAPCDSRGRRREGLVSVEAHLIEPPRKLGRVLVPGGTPMERWGPAIWGSRPPRDVRL